MGFTSNLQEGRSAAWGKSGVVKRSYDWRAGGDARRDRKRSRPMSACSGGLYGRVASPLLSANAPIYFAPPTILHPCGTGTDRFYLRPKPLRQPLHSVVRAHGRTGDRGQAQLRKTEIEQSLADLDSVTVAAPIFRGEFDAEVRFARFSLVPPQPAAPDERVRL